jgi:Fibronectin type III domain
MFKQWRDRTRRFWIGGLLALLTMGLLSACGGGDDPPGKPSQLAAVAADSQVTLTWAAASDADTYNVYWSATSGVTKATGTKIAAVSSPYVHTGRTNGTTYHYIVTASNGDGEGGASNGTRLP